MNDNAGYPTRRTVLLTGTAGLSILAIGNADFALAQDWQPALDRYQPVFFTSDEWAFVKAATARLIPEEGDGPGALSTLVPVFIDRQLAGDFGSAAHWYMKGPHDAHADPLLGFQSPLSPAEIYRAAIAELNAYCLDQKGSRFADLAPADQDAVLTDLQNGNIQFEDVSSETFFEFLLANTKEGYFADPQYGGNHRMQAWVYIGFPGARASFTEWVTQHDVPYPLGPVSISGERA
jgi:gluconate 2-dehydrogenase gamma chain